MPLLSGQLELFQIPPAVSGVPPAHHIVLGGEIIGYSLRRDRRRLSMRIDERGLAVGAPRNLALADIEAFMRQHGEWIRDKLAALASRTARRHLPIHDGSRLPVLDTEVRIRVTAGNNRGLWSDGELWLAARPAADLAALARRALQRRALEHFRPRLEETVARLGQPMPELALSSARTRWGSCSTKSGIRLNWRLIHLPTALVDYVIVHEAAHLVEMNHSARFWKIVASLCPDWQSARDELKRLGPGLPLI